MENNLLLEFLEDMFFWMEENNMDSITPEGISCFLEIYLIEKKKELEAMKQMRDEAVKSNQAIDNLIKEYFIDPAKD